MKHNPPSRTRTLARRRAGILLVASCLLVWFALSDDWHAIFNDGNASAAIGVLIAALLLAMIALLLRATRSPE
jgi:hypothetical protein